MDMGAGGNVDYRLADHLSVFLDVRAGRNIHDRQFVAERNILVERLDDRLLSKLDVRHLSFLEGTQRRRNVVFRAQL